QTMAIGATSPGFNTGTNNPGAAFPALPATDQRGTGFARIALGTVDIGAFELQPPTTVYVDDSWAGTPFGTNPSNDPIALPAPLVFGYDAFADIQSGVNAVASGGTLVIFGGTYSAAV